MMGRNAGGSFVLAGAVGLMLASPVSLAKSPAPVAAPKNVAQSLYIAWQRKQTDAAKKVAAGDAVEKLFSVSWRPMKFEGCGRREEGGFECIYTDAKADFSLAMIVEGGVSAGAYNVSSLSFSSEE